jgi:hypothetical protein
MPGTLHGIGEASVVAFETHVSGKKPLFLPEATCHDVRMSPLRGRANGILAECVRGRPRSIAGWLIRGERT